VDCERPDDAVISVATVEQVEALAREILDPERRRPIVCLTSRERSAEPALDVLETLARVADRAAVYLLPTGPLSRRLAELLPSRLEVYGGAARIWWPGVNAHSDPHDHPLLLDRYDVYASRVLDQLERLLGKGPPTQLARVDSPDLALLEGRLEDLRRTIQELSAENRRLRDELKAVPEAARVAKERRRELLARRDRTDLHAAPPPQDRDAEVRREIHEQWLSALPPDERSRRPLARFRVGPVFVDEVEELTRADRRRAMWVCAMVLCGLSCSLDGLDEHPLRSGRGGETPIRVRANDGARAFRCAVRRETPGALRLHYWRLADGTIDLASVGHHDSMDIAE
jgi:hypothetical protein